MLTKRGNALLEVSLSEGVSFRTPPERASLTKFMYFIKLRTAIQGIGDREADDWNKMSVFLIPNPQLRIIFVTCLNP